MSVRHKMRAKVEELFKMTIDDPQFPADGETTLYAIFVPLEGDYEEEDIDVVEQKVDPKEGTSVKKFLDRITREALEADVKGLKLIGFVFEGPEGLRLVSDGEGADEEVIFERIERMKEEL